MKKSSVIQFIKFGIVGVSNTLVNFVVYIIFISLGCHYAAANLFGFLVSVLNAYYWGNRYVFKEDKTKEKRIWWKVLLKTYASYAFGFVLNTVLLFLWVDVINVGKYFGFVSTLSGWANGFLPFFPESMTVGEISEIMGFVLNIFVTVPVNFIINKFWAYRQKNKPDNAKV